MGPTIFFGVPVSGLRGLDFAGNLLIPFTLDFLGNVGRAFLKLAPTGPEIGFQKRWIDPSKFAKWDGKKLVEPARATVWWNGLKVHDDVPVKKANGGVKNGPSNEGLKLQEHGQEVHYRNIWIKKT